MRGNYESMPHAWRLEPVEPVVAQPVSEEERERGHLCLDLAIAGEAPMGRRVPMLPFEPDSDVRRSLTIGDARRIQPWVPRHQSLDRCPRGTERASHPKMPIVGNQYLRVG